MTAPTLQRLAPRPSCSPVLVAAYSMLAVCAMELLARQMARRSIGSAVGWGEGPAFPSLLGAAAIAGLVGAVATWRHARRAPDANAPLGDRLVRLTLVVAFVFGLAAQQHLGARIQSDGFFYFAYLRSLAFDHDVNLANDYPLIGVGADREMGSRTATGYAHTAWSIGPALLWSPFFAAAHGVAHGLAAAGVGVKVDGTSFPYRQSVCIASLFYGLLGLWFSYRLAARFFEAVLASIAMVFMGLASFMLWYFVKEPSMSHALSMAAVAAFLWGWVATRDRRAHWQWACLGLVGGIMLAVRWQNLVFMALPAFDITLAIAYGERSGRRTLLAGAAIFGGAACVAFLPQALAWQAIYGSPLAVSPLSPKMNWWHPEIVLTLWSSRNGLFATSPITYIGAAGLLVFAWRERTIGVMALMVFGLAVYVNSVVGDWWGGAAFGARRFDGTIPLLVVGLAAAMAQGRSWLSRYPMLGVGGALGLLLAWNLTAMAVALDGSYGLSVPRSFGAMGAEQARVLHQWIGHPFSYPANLVFAGRYGLSPARWDVLAFEFLHDSEKPYGRVDVGKDDEAYLGEGWHAAEKAPDGQTFRWTTHEAVTLVPLDHAAPLLLQLNLMPFTYPNGPTAQLRVDVNGRAFGPLTLGAGWQRIEIPTDSAVWRAGVNHVHLVSLTPAVPARVGLGGDTRELGVAVDYVRVEVMK